MAVLIAATCLSACSTGRAYLRADVIAEDVRYVEFNMTTNETVAVSRNPFARAAIGYEVEPTPGLVLSGELSHTSSIRTGQDRGVNSASVSARWYFKP